MRGDISRNMKNRLDKVLSIKQLDAGKNVILNPGNPSTSEEPSYSGPTDYITSGEGINGIVVTKEGQRLTVDGAGVQIEWPPFMEQDNEGLHVYDSAEKTSKVALVGRQGEEVDVYTETSQADFEKGELDGAEATAAGLALGGGDETDDTYDTGDMVTNPYTYTGNDITTKQAIRLSKVKIKVRADGSHTLYIRQGHGTSGAILYQSTEGTAVGLGNWYEFVLTTPLILDNATQYHVGWDRPSGRIYRGEVVYDGTLWANTRYYWTSSDSSDSHTAAMGLVHEEFAPHGRRTIIPQDLTSLSTDPGLRAGWQSDEPTGTNVIVETAVKGEASYTDEPIGTGDHSLGDNVVPIMFSNTTPEGEASASSEHSSTYAAWKAFNRTNSSSTDCWASGSDPYPEWLQYEFAEAIRIGKYAITSRDDSANNSSCPRSWTFEGSNDGTNFDVLDTRIDGFPQAEQDSRREFEVESPDEYKYYRLNISDGWRDNVTAVGKLEMYEQLIKDTFHLPIYPAERHYTASEVTIKVDGTPTAEFTRANANDPKEIIFNAGHEPNAVQSEIQTLDLGGADGGTYKLGTDLGDPAEDSATLNWNDSAATIETALEGIYGAGNVTVADDSDFTIIFSTSVGASGLEFADIDLTNTTTPGLTLDTAYSAAEAVTATYTGVSYPLEDTEIQELYLGGASGGTYELGITGDMATLAHDDNAAAIETALEGIFGAGLVTVAPDTDFTITFSVRVRDSGLTADFAGLTGGTSPALTKTTAYSAGDWEEQTTLTAITNIPVGDLTGQHLWIRQTLETEDTEVTPTLEEVTVYYGTEEYGIFTADGTVKTL